MAIRIGIDATSLPPNQGGAAFYILNLIKALACIDKDNKYFIFIKDRDAFDISQSNVHFIECSSANRVLRLIWEQTVLPWYARRYRLQVLHSPHYTKPLFLRDCSSVVTFHDMTFFIYPQKHILSKQIFFKNMIPLSARSADRLIADSYSTKRDMVKFNMASEDKIEVVHPSVDKSYRLIENEALIEKIRGKYDTSSKFILYVGTIEPRKNIDGLIKAYHKAANSQGIEHRLVIAGGKGWDYERVFKLVGDLKLEERVVFTGYVPENDLPLLYNAAELFIYPSFYEGFGIPTLEAMSCGVPVISSNISSLPEVVGDGGILVDPYNIDELAEAIIKVITDEGLREELSQRGLNRARLFSWNRTAEDTLSIYREIVAA